MISLAEETSDLWGITPLVAFIDDDLGAMGRTVSCLSRQETQNAAKAGNTPTNPEPPAKPVALSPGPSKSNPAPPPKPSPHSGPSTLVNRTTNVQVRSSSPGPFGSQPQGESAARGRSTTCAGGFSSTPTPTASRAPWPSRLPLPCDCPPLSIGAASVRQRYLSQKPQGPNGYGKRPQLIFLSSGTDQISLLTITQRLLQSRTSYTNLEHPPLSTHYLPPEDGDIISQYQWKNRLLTADTWNSACTIAKIGGHLFIAFYTAPETIPMVDSDIDIIYVKTTINPNSREIPVAIKPNPDQDLEDPLQSVIPIAREVINLNDDEEDEAPASEAARVDDVQPELLPITNTATSSTPDNLPIEPADLDFEVEDTEHIIQNDLDFENMAVTEHAGGTGNDVESQALKNETMNNVYEDWRVAVCPNVRVFVRGFSAPKAESLSQLLSEPHSESLCQSHCRTDIRVSLHPHQIVAVNWMAEKTLTALALICHQVNKYEQLLKQLPPGLEQWQIKIDDIKVQEEKGQKVEKTPASLVGRFTSKH
ncbi:hypothetical protein BDD12DRAFT_808836 [Trichophaea hybrida]|nr:hypothetical protein BDD12DRAFT_808836 [Trichophaea hybrida]